MPAIPAKLFNEIEALSGAGDALYEAGDYKAAIAKYKAGYALVPAPKEEWEMGTSLLIAIGDTQFANGDFARAIETLTTASFTPAGMGNPFVHLRLGQALFETGALDLAAESLQRIRGHGDDSIFEDEDPKYLDFLQSRTPNL
ncbi:tetratricopeptide repeat protein [Jeongeupia naejangsanensis]|uniref:Tetratricopeptide repeat protein n=1 Tax=Jeongeupia naejangsanensis TaxID=613195 RepID=A0ABS2BM94_9NEIS|nr:tetratricopeptide repeat protein [Jeongeupia naejangsanensis]MBM3116718.1 tetratricopeptide repeat protein [Jeongeupia naejangsanensis]